MNMVPSKIGKQSLTDTNVQVLSVPIYIELTARLSSKVKRSTILRENIEQIFLVKNE